MAGDASAKEGAALSPREEEVLAEYADLGDQRAVAQRLGIAYATVRHHLRTAYQKLGVQSAIAAFTKLGWLRRKQ